MTTQSICESIAVSGPGKDAAGGQYIRFLFGSGTRLMRVEKTGLLREGKPFFRGRTWNGTRKEWSKNARTVVEAEVVDSTPEVSETEFVSRGPGRPRRSLKG